MGGCFASPLFLENSGQALSRDLRVHKKTHLVQGTTIFTPPMKKDHTDQ